MAEIIRGFFYDYAKSIEQTTDGGYVVTGWSESNDGEVSVNHGVYDYWVVRLDASGSVIWQKSLGGTGEDQANSVQQTIDGGYVVAGYSLSTNGNVTGNHGNSDYWVVKLDAYGNITWQKSLGGSDGDVAHSIQQTADEGYIVAGSSNSNDGDVTGSNGESDFWIVKLDTTGSITWQNSLGGSVYEYALSVKQITDGGYIVAGLAYSNDGDISGYLGGGDSWIVKLDAAGNITWQKSFGGTDSDNTNSIQQTLDGGFIIAGGSRSNNGNVTGNHGDYDFWIAKLSPETSSINEFKNLEINIYPNPTTKTFTISSDNAVNSAFKIIDAQGKEVLSGNMNGKEQSLDISELSKGVYSVVFEKSELPVLSVIKE